jgi:hypothetical protein
MERPDDPEFAHLPRAMGFEQEEWVTPTHIVPYYTCICNGKRVFVYDEQWWTQVGRLEERFAECDSQCHDGTPGDEFVLKILIMHITSEGNDGNNNG